MYYVFGLGNPGLKYKNTRHNAGFCSVEELSRRHDIKLKAESKFDAAVGQGFIGTERVTLVKPQTFMNQSGYAVSAVMDYYDAELSQMIVLYDDIDIPFGTLRIREKGSAGTHNGMRSIVDYMKTGDFTRIRIGIGKPEHGLTAHVLGKFDDKDAAGELFVRAADACECLIADGIQRAQQTYQTDSK